MFLFFSDSICESRNLINNQFFYSLLEFFLGLLFVILQIHYGFLGQFQISLKLPLGSLKVHAELLLLFQGALKL